MRNAGHAQRGDLVVDPGPATLTGPGGQAVFDSGTFLGTSVPLGGMHTEASGRLVVVGGFGASGFVSPASVPAPLTHFANNDKWYDDMSDGPVTATVRVSGRTRAVKAKPAWVIAAPPDFAPGVANFVRCQPAAGDTWLAVGDGGGAHDPLTGLGIYWALESGLAAADAIVAGGSGAFAGYARRGRERFDEYLAVRTRYYRDERCWPDATFWSSRHR